MDVAAIAGFEVKKDFALTLRALERQETELLAAATATFNRFKHLAPRRMHPGQILRQITDAARLDSAQQKELGALVLEYYASRRLEVASWLDIKKTADVKNPMEMLKHFRQTQKASWTPLRPSTSFSLDEGFGVVPVTTSVVTSFEEAEAACFGDAASLYIVTAPHGSGKTSAVLVPTEAKVRAEGGRTVVLTHRCALASSLCKAFNAADYRSDRLQDEKARSYRHPKLGADGNWNTPFPLADLSCLTVVQDSLTNPNFGAHAARADLLLVDEISQLVAAQGASGSQMSSKTQVAVQRAFFNALQSAKRVILADADVTPATLTYLARAGRPIHIIKVDVPEASMDVRVLHGAESSPTCWRGWWSSGPQGGKCASCRTRPRPLSSWIFGASRIWLMGRSVALPPTAKMNTRISWPTLMLGYRVWNCWRIARSWDRVSAWSQSTSMLTCSAITALLARPMRFR